MALLTVFNFSLLILTGSLALQKPVQHAIGIVDETSLVVPFVPFFEFLNQTRNATYDDFNDTKVDCPQAFRDMQNHIIPMYADVTIATSFVLDNDTVDCMPIMEQPAIRRFNITELPRVLNATELETGAELGRGNSSPAGSPSEQNLTDFYGNEIYCPEGTIPMNRLTLERLTMFRTLGDFFAKRPRSLGPVNLDPNEPEFLPDFDSTHLHAYALQNIPNYGGLIWPQRSGSSMQTVEGGWQVYPDYYKGSIEPMLFIYFTADNYQTTGCYNLVCAAFAMTTNRRPLGKGFDKISTLGGEQREFSLQWYLRDGFWVLYVQGEQIGGYPVSLFNGGAMATQAVRVEYGGEVARKVGNQWPEMGSGRLAAEGFQFGAYQRKIFYIDKIANIFTGLWTNLGGVDEASVSCYTVDVTESNVGGDWGTYLFYGGPGASSCN